MLRRLFHSRFFSKVFYELLPAAIVSVLGTFLINQYARPADPPPQPVASVAANAELVQLLREQQALLADFLKKTAEVRQRTGLAAAQEAETHKAAERAAMQALREAKAAEARAVAAARAARPATQSEKPVASEPLQLYPAASAVAPVQPPPQTAAPVMPPAPPRENAAVSTLRNTVSAIEQIPSRIIDWFIEPAPPRPPAGLPQRQFMKVAM